MQIGIFAGAAVVGLIAVVMVTRSGRDKPVVVGAPPVEETAPEVDVDFDGWDSAPVMAVRAVYEAAQRADELGLAARIDARRHADGLAAAHALELAAATQAGDPLEDLGPPPPTWDELDDAGRKALVEGAVRGWLEGQGDSVAALWKPYDGKVISENEEQAVVHLSVSGRADELASESRVMEWKLARDGGGWKVWSWGRYISPEEARANRSRRNKQITRVELEGGARLFQADPRPLPHLPDTSPELAASIEAAVARMLDFKVRPRENNSAEADLIAIGKPSLPILLTALYENKIVDDETLAKAVKIHHCMRSITGYDPGFPVNALGPDAELKRDVALRAWFAWWLRKGDLATGPAWERAHEICQASEGVKEFDWIHALAHRIEGDTSNAAYWYRRAGEAQVGADPAAEWDHIAARLTA